MTDSSANSEELNEAILPVETERKGLRPKFTHCDICNEELPEEELRMQAVNHRECWKAWVEEKRTRDPEPTED